MRNKTRSQKHCQESLIHCVKEKRKKRIRATETNTKSKTHEHKVNGGIRKHADTEIIISEYDGKCESLEIVIPRWAREISVSDRKQQNR